jgi:hypothetical protein
MKCTLVLAILAAAAFSFADEARTRVTAVYPTRNVLPENQLKFYIHFSAPMARGEAYQHVQLLTDKGAKIEVPFLELDQELWDPKQQRFTLFFDPGRIKRGLKSREEAGPALEQGKTYTFLIDNEWSDAKGNRLQESFRKTFRVGPPDDVPIDPARWKIMPPAEPRSPLVVDFPEPLDHALLDRLLTITDSSGKSIAGTVAISKEETRWQFQPEKPWRPGAYQLIIQAHLEDLAGNKVGRAFEVDVFEKVQRKVEVENVSLPFLVK